MLHTPSSDRTSHLAHTPPPDTNVFSSEPNTLILLYETDTKSAIMSMSAPEAAARSTPFLQRVQLLSPEGYPVRATGQVDDGAMRNCISKRRWEQYGHCLSPLSPSTIRISVANNQQIKPIGRWHGTVRVGNVSASSWFEVFESNGAFDVILGKPWLEQVDAIHRYTTDTLEITGENGDSDKLSNQTISEADDRVQAVQESALEQTEHGRETEIEERKEHDTPRACEELERMAPDENEDHGDSAGLRRSEPEEKGYHGQRAEHQRSEPEESESHGEYVEQERNEPEEENDSAENEEPDENDSAEHEESDELDSDEVWEPAAETPPHEQLDREWARIHQIRASASPWQETQWARYLTTDEPEGQDTDEEEAMTAADGAEPTKQLSARACRAAQAEETQRQRDNEGEALLTAVLQVNAAHYKAERRVVCRAKKKRDKRRRAQVYSTTCPPLEVTQVHKLWESERRISIIRAKLEYARSLGEPDPVELQPDNRDEATPTVNSTDTQQPEDPESTTPTGAPKPEPPFKVEVLSEDDWLD